MDQENSEKIKVIIEKPNLFKELRYHKDLTQTEFADYLDCAQGYISKIENDLCTPSIYFLIKFRKKLDLSWAYIEKYYEAHPQCQM